MLVAVALLLQIQSADAKSLPPLSASDSIASAKMVARARRQETVLFWYWRQAWQNQRDLLGTDPRMWSLHCHPEEVPLGDERNVIAYYLSYKAMCPIWFQEHGSRPDENINIDNGIPAKSVGKIRERRASVIALLDSAGRLDPGNPWILGQRIRLNVDQKEYVTAALLAAEHCFNGAMLCAMFEGYVEAAAGNRKGAERLFQYAAAVMNPSERCLYLDASVFFENDERRKSEALACAERASLDEKFWWLADPLWIKTGNERLAIHLERQVLLLLKSSVTVDEHFDYRPEYGGASVAEMILRYGWPSVNYFNRVQSDNHYERMGRKDSTANASHEYFRPRYHSTPPLSVVEQISDLRGRELGDVAPPWLPRKRAYDEFWWPIEHFPRAGPVLSMDFQSAVLRRKRGPVIVVAADPTSQRVEERQLTSYTTALVAMTTPSDSGVRSTTPTRLESTGASVALLNTRPGLQIVSAEILDLDRDSLPAVRSRFAVTAPAGIDSLGSGELAVSDPILFGMVTGQVMPRSANDVFEHMLPYTDLRGAPRVGVFFELYGLQRDEQVDVTMTVTSIDQPGFLRRLGARLGAGSTEPGSFTIRWEAGQPGTSSSVSTIDGALIHSRAMVVNLEALKTGKYLIEMGVGRGGKIIGTSRREFQVAR